MDSKEITARVCAAVVGATLALAGAGKFTSWNQWLSNARRQHLWKVVAIALPAIELVLGAALLVLKPASIVLGLATLLLVVCMVTCSLVVDYLVIPLSQLAQPQVP